MADVDQADDAAHRFGVVHLERVVQGERVDVDDARLEADLGEQGEFGLDQLALGGDEQHGHLETLALGVQDLEVELHVVHVERHVLLGLPADDFARLRLLHPVHRDLLDDHVAAADRGDDLLGLDAGGGHEAFDGVGHERGVHDLALDDRVAHDGSEGDLGEDRFAGAVGHGDELDEPASDVQGHGGRVPAEQCHRCPIVIGVNELRYHRTNGLSITCARSENPFKRK